MALRARALYDFRSENPGEISLREHEVLSLCSEQDIEGWLEGVNSRGDRGLFPASYVQVIRAPEPGPAGDGGPGAPARYANVPPGGFEPLPVAPPASFKPPPDAFQPLLQPQQAPPPSTFQPPGAGFPYGGGALQPSPQQLYGGYQASQGSDDDWDDEWDDSSTVADEPGALGSGAYPDLDGSSSAGVGAAGRYRLSTRSDLSLGSRGGSAPPQHHPSGAKSSATVSRNLNRFSTFVKSGGEAFVLGEASGFVKDGDKLCVVLGPYGPEWQENPYPFQCTIDDPTKQTKFKGMKSYISYKLVPTHTQVPVHRRYKHFDWLYARLAEKFPVISVPHLPEKQATGRFEEDFISKRRKGLIWWMNHMASHPVLAQCDVFQHFLTCPSSTDEKAWKQGKRKAEKDEMVGANFFLTLSTPPAAALDLQEVESKIDGFKCFTKKMDDSALQLNHTANEFARKQVTGFKKEYQKVGQSFRGLSQAFELDQQAFSVGLNQAIAFTGDAYDAIGELFAEQPRQDLDPVMDLLALYQGHLANFPDIIHVQKDLFLISYSRKPTGMWLRETVWPISFLPTPPSEESRTSLWTPVLVHFHTATKSYLRLVLQLEGKKCDSEMYQLLCQRQPSDHLGLAPCCLLFDLGIRGPCQSLSSQSPVS
ncbi:sorting nexin-18 isoform X2 [Hylobates moloch]|uniref:sorting nexin-18 isoform X1 n=1 Tax=Hylobates moloch TaxID=81572 RepID=UPI002441DA3D|nr:sorting nexin-18 isoform X2 [Symphalangus syndactylus]XP_058289959.1 sorting nexin-18 isoform X1 [Hylobates moloch]XP_058289960.1 sorting nexin-18 isoform X2 [Hylobates moloch]